METTQLVRVQRQARASQQAASSAALAAPMAQTAAAQTENIRKMLLAFSRDLRVVLLRLASRLQTLRWFAASRTPCPEALAREAFRLAAAKLPLATTFVLRHIGS
jgi:GTP pyrophosphokinase